VTGNEDINCATLSLTAGTDFTLTNISTITSITQTSSDVCTIIAVSTATANGDAVVSTLTRASTFSIDDTAGNSQTVLAGSPQSVTVTRNGEPNAPVISSVTAGNAQVTVVWSTPASNGSTITDYLIKYSLSADGTYTTFADGVSTATSATVTGLTNGTAYYFKVAATNSVGTGSYSAASADATPTMPTLTISYAAGSGSGTAPVSPVSVLSGSTFTTPTNTYTRTGYTFAGWSDGLATYAAAATYPSSGTVASNVTLTAQWTANTLTVTTDEQGGTAIDSASTTTGASMSLPGTPTRTGYTFAGWFVATSGGSAITFPYAHGQTADFTLYAQWTANTLTVTYNSQSGSSITAGSTSTGGSIAVSPGTPTRTGYTFAGWFVATSGGSAITFPYAHGQTANFTLYAQWTAATCANGGACIVGNTGPGGGKVFYVSSSNFTSTGSDCGTACKYLEAAPSDHSSQVAWCSNITSSLGVTATGIGSGMSNTTTADSTCPSGAIQVAADYANNSKTDWHLPSKDELAQLYIQRITVGGFTDHYRYSSSEGVDNDAWAQYFGDGNQLCFYKLASFYVRPVRAFG
jgi:uncharacterized repeat protein (TIGR02543 family)